MTPEIRDALCQVVNHKRIGRLMYKHGLVILESWRPSSNNAPFETSRDRLTGTVRYTEALKDSLLTRREFLNGIQKPKGRATKGVDGR
jgi:hypothetical protein